MSATGILILIIAVWIVLNADKLAWVFLGQLQLNTTNFTATPNNRGSVPQFGGGHS